MLQVEIKGQNAIAAILRYGSIISSIVMAVGVTMAFLRGTAMGRSENLPPRALLMRVLEFDPLGITQLGMLLLLLTPVFRIVVAIAAFGMERDFKYVLVSVGVLLIVIGSMTFALK